MYCMYPHACECMCAVCTHMCVSVCVLIYHMNPHTVCGYSTYVLSMHNVDFEVCQFPLQNVNGNVFSFFVVFPRKEIITKVINYVHLNLCISLICGLIVFLAGIQAGTSSRVRTLYVVCGGQTLTSCTVCVYCLYVCSCMRVIHPFTTYCTLKLKSFNCCSMNQ